MSFSKSIAVPVAAVTAVCGVLALTGDAEAYEFRSGTILGYHAEILDSGSYTELDYIEVFGPNGKEEIFVTCAPYDWESTGPNTADFVNSIAEAWCF